MKTFFTYVTLAFCLNACTGEINTPNSTCGGTGEPACTDTKPTDAGSQTQDLSTTDSGQGTTNSKHTSDAGEDLVEDVAPIIPIPGTCDGNTLADHFVTVPIADSVFPQGSQQFGSSSVIGGHVYTAPTADNGAFIAWQQNNHVRVVQVRADGSLVRQHNFEDSDVYGLAVRENNFALLLFRRPDVLALVVADHDGTIVTDRVLMGNVDHNVAGNRWFGDLIREGRLISTVGGWMAYNTVQRRSGNDGVAHYGDEVRLFAPDGTDIARADWGIGWSWGCSHAMEVRISHNGNDYGAICSSDCYPEKGVVYNDRYTLWTDEQASDCAGRWGTSLGASVPTNDAFWMVFSATENRASSDIAINRVSGLTVDPIVWLTADETNDAAPNGAMYGDKLLVAWASSTGANFVHVNDPDGAIVAGPEVVPGVNLGSATDFFLYPNGDIGWAQRGTTTGIALARLRYCP